MRCLDGNNGHEFEQTPRHGEGQGSLVCCSPWGCKESDITQQLNETIMPRKRASVVRTCLPVQKAQEMWVQSLDREDPLQKEQETHSSFLAWEIPWTGELGGLQSMGLRKSQTQLNTHAGAQRISRKGSEKVFVSYQCVFRREASEHQYFLFYTFEYFAIFQDYLYN